MALHLLIDAYTEIIYFTLEYTSLLAAFGISPTKGATLNRAPANGTCTTSDKSIDFVNENMRRGVG